MIRRRYGLFDRWLMGVPVTVAMLVTFVALKAFRVPDDWAGNVVLGVGVVASVAGWVWVRRRKYPPEVEGRPQ